MKKNYLILILTLICFSPLISNEQKIDCFDQYYPYSYSYATPSKCDISFFEGDYIYWKAATPIIYAVKAPNVNPNIFSFFAAANEYQASVSMKFHSGYRLKWGLYLPNKWSAYIGWTQYFGKGNNFITSDGQFLTRVETIANLWSSVPLTDTVFDQFPEDAKARQEVRLKFLDFILMKNLSLGKCFHLYPFAGIRAGWIKVDMSMLYRQINPPTGDFAFNHVDLNNHFRALGIIAGIKSEWLIYKGLEIFGDAYLSGLYGKYDLRHKQMGLAFPDATIAVPFTVTSHQGKHEAKSIFQYIMGIQWKQCICKNRLSLGFKVGYEIGVFINQIQIQFGSPVVSSLGSSSANPIRTGYDLAYHGLVASGKLDF
jgi:Legionella pneumophila major outer membrane protein precursor